MKPLVLISAIAMLFGPAVLAPSPTTAQTYGVERDWYGGAFHDGDGPDRVYLAAPPAHGYYQAYRYPGYGSPNFHPPIYGAPLFGRPGVAPSRFAQRTPPGYDPERPSRSGWRRGQHLPSAFRGEIVSDYARYHLRRPPRGYCWYRDADDYILASVSEGLIFEVISGD